MVEVTEKIRVKFQAGREFDDEITGRGPQSDLAVIEIEAGGLPALSWGDCSQLEIGEWVGAIGSPFGLSQTLTVGVVLAVMILPIITAVSREVFLQTPRLHEEASLAAPAAARRTCPSPRE